jgi:hypothetical protein
LTKLNLSYIFTLVNPTFAKAKKDVKNMARKNRSYATITEWLQAYNNKLVTFSELPEEAQRLLQGNSPYQGIGGEDDNYETMLAHGLPGHEGHYDGGQGFE